MLRNLTVLSWLCFASAAWADAPTGPVDSQTPGVLCRESDADFDKLDYPERIPRCRRNVSEEEKLRVAHAYGDLPKNQWSRYEFDHLIPLCAGGSNDEQNLWPQPLAEAHEKDKLEDEICTGMKNGTLQQVEAVAKVHDWFTQRVANAALSGR